MLRNKANSLPGVDGTVDGAVVDVDMVVVVVGAGVDRQHRQKVQTMLDSYY